jgi:hypothetical protein
MRPWPPRPEIYEINTCVCLGELSRKYQRLVDLATVPARGIAPSAMDPFERAEYEGMDYERWFIEHMFAFAPAAGYVGQWLQSFRKFPPRQKPGSFNLDRVMEAVTKPQGSGK